MASHLIVQGLDGASQVISTELSDQISRFEKWVTSPPETGPKTATMTDEDGFCFISALDSVLSFIKGQSAVGWLERTVMQNEVKADIKHYTRLLDDAEKYFQVIVGTLRLVILYSPLLSYL
jgi:hypothetical protein